MCPTRFPKPPGAAAIRVEVDPETHAKIRMLAAAAKMPMSAYCRAVLTEHADVDGSKRSRKKSQK